MLSSSYMDVRVSLLITEGILKVTSMMFGGRWGRLGVVDAVMFDPNAFIAMSCRPTRQMGDDAPCREGWIREELSLYLTRLIESYGRRSNRWKFDFF